MKMIDMHCDTLLGTGYGEEIDLYENNKAVDFKRLKAAGFTAQFYAMCLMPEESFLAKGMKKPSDADFMDALSGCFYKNLEKYSDYAAFAGNLDDMLRNEKEGKISCFLTAEDGNGINGTLAGLEKMYKMGIRLISITWNHENCLGYPNSFDPEKMALPLKPFGCEMIDAMNRMGIIADVSHLSDGGFWDVVKHSSKPFVASHSNARELCPVMRNLTDDMLRAVADKGGMVGLNYAADFLVDKTRYTYCADIARHARYMADKAGVDIVALGSDFDGISSTLEFGGVEGLGMIEEALNRCFTADEVDKITHLNALRVIKDTVG